MSTNETNITAIATDLIDAIDRVRDLDQAWVITLADKIAQSGYQAPILVRPTADGRYRLVIGGHRLEAVRLLGLEATCEVRELDDDEARRLEIEENLFRRELDKLDFGLFYLEHQAVETRLGNRQKVGGDRRSDPAKSFRKGLRNDRPRFTQEIADRIGRSERSVQMAIQMVKNLDSDAVKLLRGSKFADNQQALLAVSGIPKARQRGAVQDLLDGRYKTASAARDAYSDRDPQAPVSLEKARHDAGVTRLIKAWMALDEDARCEAVQDIVADPESRAAFCGVINTVLGTEIE